MDYGLYIIFFAFVDFFNSNQYIKISIQLYTLPLNMAYQTKKTKSFFKHFLYHAGEFAANNQ